MRLLIGKKGKYRLAAGIAVLIIGILIIVSYLTNNPAAKQTVIDLTKAVIG